MTRTGHARERRALTRIRELYALVPDVGCRGLCTAFCVPIHMSTAEAATVDAAAPNAHRADGCSPLGAPRCPQLAADGRCSVYDDRPMICRLWGASTHMRCPHGCEPRAGYLSAQECLELMLLTLELGGTDLLDPGGLADVRACVAEPGLAEAVLDLLQGDHTAARRVAPLIERVTHALREHDLRDLPLVQEAVQRLRNQAGTKGSPLHAV